MPDSICPWFWTLLMRPLLVIALVCGMSFVAVGENVAPTNLVAPLDDPGAKLPLDDFARTQNMLTIVK
jgi:hypothetical protein